MLNYLKNFAVQIVPSVAATVIGAYIVNHYINARPAADAPKAAAVSTAQPKSDAAKSGAVKSDTDKADGKVKPDAEIAGIPASGVKAKGISEKALLEKNAAAEKAVVVEKPAEKVADRPEKADKAAETTASLPAEPKRPAPPRVAKSPPPAAPSVVAAAPAEAGATVDDRRDANDLARAAIERLRGNGEAAQRPEASQRPEPSRPEASQRPQPAPRAPELVHVPEEPRVITASPPALRPLPPPIAVAVPAESPDPATLRVDPSRPTPPAEIPTARPPLDLRAEAAVEPPKQKTNVAEDVLSAAKSMFHAVLPK